MGNSQDQTNVPDEWKDTAKKMLEAAEKEAKRQGLLMAVAIADSGGNLVAFHRMDNTMLASTQIAMDKAFTAVFGKVPSIVWGEILRSGEIPPLFIHQRWTPFPGGFPLIRDGAIFGGVGVSGATMYGDTSVARAAAAAGGFQTHSFDAILSKTSD
jgi:uncharacterized protein GlcG (DUF336 family)